MNKKLLSLELLHGLSSSILNSTDEADIEKNLEVLLQFYDVINYEYSYSQELFRARKCQKDGYAKTYELDCPPADLVKAGRLNEPNQPILYTSISSLSTLEEIKADEGDYIHVVAYEITEKLRCAIIGEIAQYVRWGRTLSSNVLDEQLDILMRKLPEPVKRSLLFSDSFLSSIIKNPNASKNNYIHSRKVASILFKKFSYIDAIIYQWLALESSFNLAIRPCMINKKIKQTGNFVLYVNKKYGFGLYDLKVIKNARGHTSDRNILWELD